MFSLNGPVDMAEKMAEIVLASPGISRGEVIATIRTAMEAGGRVFGKSDVTVYRWLKTAIEMGWITREGNTANSVYYPTESIRLRWLRASVAKPVAQRPRVRHNSDFLDMYEPNSTFYLAEQHRERLERQCPIGSAPLKKIGEHDVSLFLCDLAYSSSRLEGNEYDYASTVALIDHRVEKDGASREDRVMIQNHHEAVRYMIDSISPIAPVQPGSTVGSSSLDVRPLDIRSLHAILSNHLMTNPRHCGAMRQSRVKISETAYLPLDIPAQIVEAYEMVLAKAIEIKNPWEQSLFLNVHLPYVQPFEDCNKRTARVACNIPLLRAGVTPMSWTDVSRRDYLDGMVAVYEMNDPLLLADVFTEGYLRSNERFQLMRRTQEPDEMVCTFRHEIRQAVRSRILDDSEAIPSNVPQAQALAFIKHVEAQVEALLDNPVSAARFGMTHSDVESFEARCSQAAESSGTRMRERAA